MFKLLANAAFATSLLFGATVAAPAWSAERSTSQKSKCPNAKHKHAKRTTVAAKPQPARGVTVVEHKKLDVQILSFGP